jgi:glutathione S-transferase
MKLLASLTSPYVRKVRIVMAEKKLDYQMQLVDVWSPETPMQEYNPLGKVPCLITEDGNRLFDSRVIAEYVDTLSPVSQLIPKTGRERAEAKCWEALADGTLDAAVTIIKEKQRSPAQQSQEWIDRQYGKIHAAIKHMEAELGTKSFCMGVNFSLADVSVGCVLGFLDFRFAHIEWRAESPNLDRLYTKLRFRQSFIDTEPPKQ